MNNTKDNLIAERDRLRAVNAQLLRACESALNAMCIGANADETMLQACEVIRAAIAQAEQGAKGRKDGAS